MKTPFIAIVSVLLSTVGWSQQILKTGFDSGDGFTVGDLGTQGGFFVTGLSGSSTITISSAQAYDGTQALLVLDGDTAGRPYVNYSLGNNYSNGSFEVAILKYASGGSPWYISFQTVSGAATFSITCDGGSSIKLIGSDGSTTLGTYTNTGLGNLLGNWTLFKVAFNESSNTASIFLDGSEVLSVSDTATNWTVGKFILSNGYGSGTNLGMYYDAISFVAIPEAGVSQLLGMAFAILGVWGLYSRRPRLSALNFFTASHFREAAVFSSRK